MVFWSRIPEDTGQRENRARCYMTASQAEDTRHRKIRVMLVDDSEHFVRAARRTLALEEGIEVVGTAASADEALERLAQLDPDVVLMDMSMPGSSGLDATRAVKGRWPAVRVIILTAHDTASYEAAAERAGADAVVGKWMLEEQAVPAILGLGRPQKAGARQADNG